ncbi:MAG TPA: CHASE domain-containing protein, partial [Dongiaceae bacterium]|nr:CHASE domain-containing protein [Dongiaceae bacterium]
MEKTRLKVILWTAGALVCCLLVAAVTAWQVDHYNRQVADGEVEEAAEDAANAVISRLNLYQYGLRGSRGAVLTAGENISRELFRRYSQSRDLNREFPGARGFGFIRRVSVKSEARFLASARADDWPEFNIHQLSPHEGERFVIQYIEPIESNIQAIGLDIASETNRREAAWAAMRTGEVHLTGPITLVQATGLPFQSFLILMPIYRDVAVPTTVAAREKAAVGWTYAPLVMKDVLGGLGLERAGTHLELKDITVPGHVESFFHSLDTEPNIAGTLTHSLERDVFGRRWEFQFSAQPSFVDKLNLLSPTWVMTLGTFFSVLVAALVGMAVSSFERRRQFLVEQARLAAIVESSGDGIIGKTLQGVVTSWNKAAERIFGYSAEEAIGRSLAHLVVPRDLWHEEDDILARVGRGEQITNFTTRRQHRDGGFLDVSVTVSPIRDASGKVVGASKTARDISVQKATERRIHELNVNLEAQVAQRTAELTRVNHLIASVLSAATEVSIIATDSDGTIRLFNRGAERMFGYLAEDMVGQRNILELHVSNEIRARGEELSERLRHEVDGIRVLAEMPASQAAETREWTLVRRGGAVFPAMVAVTAMRDDAGQTGGLLAVAVDISVQNRQRSELLATRDQLAMAAEVAGLGIWTWVLADDSLHWNPRMFQIYNYPLSMGMGGLEFSSWHRRIHPDDVQMMMDSLTAAVEGRGTFDVIFRIVLPEGGVRYIQASAQVERDDHQVPIQV